MTRVRRWTAGIVLGGSVVVATMASLSPTLAVFTDSSQVAGGSLSSHALVSQASPVCSNQGGVAGLLGFARLSWTHVDARYDYAWTATRVSNGTTVGSGVVVTNVAVGSAVTLDVSSDLLDLGVGGQNVDVTVRARLKLSPSWVAPSATTSRVHTNAVVLGLSVRCGSA